MDLAFGFDKKDYFHQTVTKFASCSWSYQVIFPSRSTLTVAKVLVVNDIPFDMRLDCSEDIRIEPIVSRSSHWNEIAEEWRGDQ